MLEYLVNSLSKAEDFEKLADYADIAYDLGSKLYGERSEYALHMLLSAATAERELKKYSSALTKYKLLYHLYCPKYGEKDDDTTHCLYFMALTAELSWSYREAAKYYRELYDICRRAYGADDERTAKMRSKYFECDKY